MGWRSSLLILIIVFGVLFSVLYLSTLTAKSTRSLKEPIHPKILQIGALEIVLADEKMQNPDVNDLRLYFNQYNFSSNDFQKYPERYRGYQYSLVNDVREHPELLRVLTMYLHPNGTKYIIDVISGKIIPYNDTSGFLSRYCLQGKYCDRSVYNVFANRVVFLVDAINNPVNVSTHFTGAWVDADTGEIVWGNTQIDQSIMAIPPHVQFFDNSVGRTIKQLLNPPQTTNVEIAYGAGNFRFNEFLPNSVRAILDLGNKVDWRNNDVTRHTVTSDDGYSDNIAGKFDSGIIEAGKSYHYTFTKEGRYSYHCQIHPYMKGEVLIVANFS